MQQEQLFDLISIIPEVAITMFQIVGVIIVGSIVYSLIKR